MFGVRFLRTYPVFVVGTDPDDGHTLLSRGTEGVQLIWMGALRAASICTAHEFSVIPLLYGAGTKPEADAIDDDELLYSYRRRLASREINLESGVHLLGRGRRCFSFACSIARLLTERSTCGLGLPIAAVLLLMPHMGATPFSPRF